MDDSKSPLRLAVFDAHNLDMSLGRILERKPDPDERPRIDVLASWLADRARPGEEVEACYFVNVSTDRVGEVKPWLRALREAGYAVFAKPRVNGSDVDEDILNLLEARTGSCNVVEVVLGSGDQKAFGVVVAALVASGVTVTVVGFAEHTGWALTCDGVTFVDLRDIRGLFGVALPREPVLERLPPDGAWFSPLGPLGARRSELQLDRASMVLPATLALQADLATSPHVGDR